MMADRSEPNGIPPEQSGLAPVYVFFDFDDTLLRGHSILYWLSFYYRKRPFMRIFQVFNWAAMFLMSIRIIDSNLLKRVLMLPIAYGNRRAINHLASEFVNSEIAPRLFGDMLQRMWAHHTLGHKLVVITASCNFYMRKTLPFFPPCLMVATHLFLPDHGLWRMPRYKAAMRNVKGRNKVRLIRVHKELPLKGDMCFSYSDHISDRYLLRFTEFPYVVNPHPAMERKAREEGWPVLYPRDGRKYGIARKLGNLVRFFLHTGPRGSKKEAGIPAMVKEQWQSGNRMPLSLFMDLKNRVEREYPEAVHTGIHRHVFPGMPGRKDIYKALHAMGLDTSRTGETEDFISLTERFEGLELEKEGNTWKLVQINKGVSGSRSGS